MDFPITFDYNKDSLVSVHSLPSRVSLNVTGGGWNLLKRSLGFSGSPIQIDLENPIAQKFLTQYNLLNIATDQLEDIEVNFVINDTIYFDIEPKISSKLKVRIDTTTIQLADNYEMISEISVQPDSVEITGPESIVNNLNGVVTLNLLETEIDDNISEQISVTNQLEGPISSSPDEVTVSFQVEEFETVETRLRIERKNFPGNSVFLMSKGLTDATVYLPASRVENLDTAKISVIADYNKLNANDSTIEIQLVKKPGFIKKIDIPDRVVKIIYQ